MYRLIDTDTDEVIATGETAAEVLAATPYLPADVVEGAETWDDVVNAAAQHTDGFAGILEGYRVERVEPPPFTVTPIIKSKHPQQHPRIIERSFHPSLYEAENAIAVSASFGSGGVLFYEAFLTGSEARLLRLMEDDSSRTWFWLHPPCGTCGEPLFGEHINCQFEETTVLWNAYALWEERQVQRRQSS